MAYLARALKFWSWFILASWRALRSLSTQRPKASLSTLAFWRKFSKRVIACGMFSLRPLRVMLIFSVFTLML